MYRFDIHACMYIYTYIHTYSSTLCMNPSYDTYKPKQLIIGTTS